MDFEEIKKNSKCFAFIIDNELVKNICFHVSDEKMIAIFSSNPKIVLNEQEAEEGWQWDGQKFYDPSGD